MIWSLLFITNRFVALIGKRDSYRVTAPFWEWVSTDIDDFWSCKYSNWTVIWSLLCITDVLAACIGKWDCNTVTAPVWEWVSMEHQRLVAVHHGWYIFRLVADIDLWDIGSLQEEKQQSNAPCRILKLSVNRESTDFDLAYFLIKVVCGPLCI